MVTNSPADAGDMGSVPGPGRSHVLEKLSLWTTTIGPVL